MEKNTNEVDSLNQNLEHFISGFENKEIVLKNNKDYKQCNYLTQNL